MNCTRQTLQMEHTKRFGPVGMRSLFLLVCSLVVLSKSERVDYEDVNHHCDGGEYDVDITIYPENEVYLSTGIEWPSNTHSCTVLLESVDNVVLYYEFESFANSTGFTVNIQSGFNDNLLHGQATYDATNIPNLSMPEKANKYLRITITRDSSTSSDILDFILRIYRADTIVTYVTPKPVVKLSLGAIVGIAFGAIILIIVVVVAVACGYVTSTNRRRGTVIMHSSQPDTMRGQPRTEEPFSAHKHTVAVLPAQPYHRLDETFA